MKKLCHVHGPEAKHSYDKCCQNLRIVCMKTTTTTSLLQVKNVNTRSTTMMTVVVVVAKGLLKTPHTVLARGRANAARTTALKVATQTITILKATIFQKIDGRFFGR